jgi:hypothetical protein
MTRRRTALAVVCLLIGVGIVLSVPHRVWQPTVESPNYWEGHTGVLTTLVLQVVFGSCLVAAGFALGFADVARYLPSTGVRLSGLTVLVGSLIWYSPETVPVISETTGEIYLVRAGVFALLVVGVGGVLARYPPSRRLGRYGGGVLAGGFSLLAGANLLRWSLRTVEPQTGALSYPPLGVTAAGTLAVIVGSVLLGAELRSRDDAPRWLWPLFTLSGILTVPLGVAPLLQYNEAIGLYCLAMAVVGAHLLVK